MRRAERWIAGLSAAGLAALVSACAGAPRDASLPIDDPNEQFNRGVLRLNQVVLDPPATVVKSVPGAIRNRLRGFGRQPERAARPRQRPPPGPLQRRRHHGRPHHLQHHLRPRRPVRRRGARRIAAADRRFRPDHVRLGRSVRRLCRVPRISVPRRNATRSAESWTRSAILSAGLWAGLWIGWPWSVGSGALSAVAHLAPMETG